MRFEWDENKRQANLTKHKLDLIRGSDLFDGRPVFISRSHRHEEVRFLTVGVVAGDFLTLVWTQRGEAVRLISLRKARNAEKRGYQARHGRGN
jgi:uncharacterized DUF497 family protein